jgi:hypothetical protein
VIEGRKWHFSEAPDQPANVCLSKKFGRTLEQARLLPLTDAVEKVLVIIAEL